MVHWAVQAPKETQVRDTWRQQAAETASACALALPPRVRTDSQGSLADVCGVEGTSLMCPPEWAGVIPTFLQPPHHEGGQDKV